MSLQNLVGVRAARRRPDRQGAVVVTRPPPAAARWPTQHERLWIYDLRTNQHFTLKTNPLKHGDLDEFVRLYRADSRLTRRATFREDNPQGRWRSCGVDELLARDKASLDIVWLKDESLSDSDKLPAPDVIAAEIIEDLQAALDQLKELEIGRASCRERV